MHICPPARHLHTTPHRTPPLTIATPPYTIKIVSHKSSMRMNYTHMKSIAFSVQCMIEQHNKTRRHTENSTQSNPSTNHHTNTRKFSPVSSPTHPAHSSAHGHGACASGEHDGGGGVHDARAHLHYSNYHYPLPHQPAAQRAHPTAQRTAMSTPIDSTTHHQPQPEQQRSAWARLWPPPTQRTTTWA